MWTGKLRAVAVATPLALVAIALSACGSSGDDTTAAQPPPVAPETAEHLAKLSDRIASDLDTGDTCHAAHAADDLQAAVDDADLPATMRSDVDEVAGRLVEDVNCPPPPAPAPKPEKDKKKEEEHGNPHSEDHDDEGNFIPPGHVKQGGLGPGKEKLKGEEG